MPAARRRRRGKVAAFTLPQVARRLLTWPARIKWGRGRGHHVAWGGWLSRTHYSASLFLFDSFFEGGRPRFPCPPFPSRIFSCLSTRLGGMRGAIA